MKNIKTLHDLLMKSPLIKHHHQFGCFWSREVWVRSKGLTEKTQLCGGAGVWFSFTLLKMQVKLDVFLSVGAGIELIHWL